MAELLTKFIEDGGAALGVPLLLVLFALRWLDNERRKLATELNLARERERALLLEIAFLREDSERPTDPDTPSARIRLKSKPRI